MRYILIISIFYSRFPFRSTYYHTSSWITLRYLH
nr:MAG TPA: hypothetical protein [Caudoviricetes sp.]